VTRVPSDDYAYLTTTGRVSGRPHTVEIWYASDGSTVYLLSGGGDRSDWVRNLVRNPAVRIRIGDEEFGGTARVLHAGPEDETARDEVFGKYQPRYRGSLTSWRAESLAVAVDLHP
jgi:deazaflavin-dependent oxidoreductase (nitroreductase family)